MKFTFEATASEADVLATKLRLIAREYQRAYDTFEQKTEWVEQWRRARALV